MPNSIVNLDNLLKMRYILYSIVSLSFLLLSHGCALTENHIGKLISTHGGVYYPSPNIEAKTTFSINASPAIVIAQHDTQWLRVMAVNSQIGWIKGPHHFLASTSVTAHKTPLDITTFDITQKSTDAYRWRTIKADLKWKLIGASKLSYNHTPVYISEQGRGNLLPKHLSPFNFPELQITSGVETGWARIVNLQFNQVPPLQQLHPTGLVLRPFLGLLATEMITSPPPPSTSFLNLSPLKREKIKLPNIQWQTEAMLILPASSTTQFERITFYTHSSQQSYAIELLWRNGEKQYLAFTGWLNGEMNSIATPILLGYKIADFDHDGDDEFQLEMAHVDGDNYGIQRIVIDGDSKSNTITSKISDP